MRRFQIPPWVALAEDRLDNLHERHQRDLDAVVRCKEKNLEYSTVYRDQYDLVIHGRGPQVHAMVVRALRTLALAVEWAPYQRRMRLIMDLSMHLDRSWAPQHPQYAPLLVVAIMEWNRLVSKRWRRVCRLVRWIARIPRLMVAFNEVALRPGSKPARRAAERFKVHAALLCTVSAPNDF
jgi:hypothetical protein